MLRSLGQVIPQLVPPGSFESLGNQPLNNSAQLLAGIRHGLGKHMGMGVCVCDVYVHASVYTWMYMYMYVYMWQSCVEIKDYSAAYFGCIAAFKHGITELL